jgi:hypothetical protein
MNSDVYLYMYKGYMMKLAEEDNAESTVDMNTDISIRLYIHHHMMM